MKKSAIQVSAENAAILRELRRTSKSSIAEARALFQDFRDMDPSGVKVAAVRLPKAVIEMGDCVEIAYRVERNGRVEYYRHEFKGATLPVLAASPKRGGLYLIGGAYHVTGRGIVDLNARGEEIE